MLKIKHPRPPSQRHHHHHHLTAAAVRRHIIKQRKRHQLKMLALHKSHQRPRTRHLRQLTNRLHRHVAI